MLQTCNNCLRKLLKKLIVFFHRSYASDLENPKREVCSLVLTVPIIIVVIIISLYCSSSCL